MSKVILGLLSLVFFISITGCQTVKNGVLGIGKGLADDAYNTWQAVNKADEWFRENYW
ncbi:MAG: hypothetical protein ABIE75_04170 [Candidatus Omnitrophota bacterium]